MDKRRDYDKINCVMETVLIGGDIAGKIAIVIDDIADSFGTMDNCSKELMALGARSAIVIVSHGIFSKNAIKLINENDNISHVVVTDTIDQTENMKLCSKISLVETHELFGKVIKRLISGESLSNLFV
jgi:ribose-phosphate pyrophosphokinase